MLGGIALVADRFRIDIQYTYNVRIFVVRKCLRKTALSTGSGRVKDPPQLRRETYTTLTYIYDIYINQRLQ